MRRRKLTWHLGLGPAVGNVFWAMIGIEAAFGAYVGIWPLWIEALGAPITLVGLILGVQGILRLVTLAPSAALAERFDPGKLIVWSRVATLIGLVTAGLATHWTMLAPMIIGTAIGEIAFPLTQAHLAANARENRVRAFTLVFNVGPAVAFGVSPLIAGGLIALYGMRSAFFLAAACTAFSIFFFARFKTAERPEEEQESRSPSTYREALAEPHIKSLLTLQSLAIFSMALGISLLPTFLNDARGIPPSIVAIMGGIGSVGAIIYGLIVARSRKLQNFPLVSIAIAVCFVIATFAICLFAYSPWIIGIAFIGRGGLWSAWGLFVAALGEITRTDRIRPRVFTLSEMIGGTSWSAAPVLSGQLYAISPNMPLVAGIIACGALVPVLIGLQKRLGNRLGPGVSQLSPVESFEPEVT